MKSVEEKYVPLVLTNLSMLKEDTYTAGQEAEAADSPGFIGASNFRSIGGIFGLSNPTAEGIHNIVSHHKNRLIWINLREEPVVFINDRAFILRDMKDPFSSIKSFTGCTYKRMEEVENRLKKDIIGMAKASNGMIKVYAEKSPKSLLANSMSVRKVETARDLFTRIEGVWYYRIPMGRISSREFFVSELDRILCKHQAPGQGVPECAIGFGSGYCQDDVLHGMSACLLRSALVNKVPIQEGAKISGFAHVIRVLEKALEKSGQSLADFLVKTGNIFPALEKALLGNYDVVDRMIHAMNMPDIKHNVNTAVSALKYRLLPSLLENVIAFQCTESVCYLKKSANALERYVSLVLYALYCTGPRKGTFSEWIAESSIAQGIIHEICKRPSKKLFMPAVVQQKGIPEEEWSAVIGAGTVLQADRNMNSVLEKLCIENEHAGKGEEKAKTEKCPAPKSEQSVLLQGLAGSFPWSILQIHQPNTHTRIPIAERPLLWINLRAEPVVYIEGTPHSERDRARPGRNIKTLPGITDELVNNQEEILIRRIQTDGSQSMGEIVLFAPEQSTIKTRMTNIQLKKVQTCREFITESIPRIKYVRIPMVSRAALTPNIVDTLHGTLFAHRNMPIVLQASGYLGRNRTVYVLARVVERAGGMLAEGSPHPQESRPIMIRPIETLIRILRQGIVAEGIVRNAWKEATGEEIYDPESEFHKNPNSLVNYSLMVMVASYILEGTKATFREWLSGRKDAQHVYESISAEAKEIPVDSAKQAGGENSVLPEKAKGADREVPSQNENSEEDPVFIPRPWGRVITPHTILKNDFFPALRILRADATDMKGCCNFRAIESAGDTIAGLAQPTAWGVHSLVAYFQQKSPASVNWFCLRQEPVVYINGFPFVLRNTDAVYENVITEGINRKWVEDIEERMKKDCLEESAQSGLIVHSEEVQEGKSKLVSEVIRTGNVLTPKEVFVRDGMKYFRMPISDEQTPLPEIFDEMYRVISSMPKPRILVFSCQMGRGRTTTGMIISRLITFTEHLDSVSPQEKAEILLKKRMGIVYPDEHEIISRLVQVLPMGREGKNLVDEMIQECDHIQNVYEAIAKQKDSAGYLARYFYLLCFGSFLLEKEERTFSEYLGNRTEIGAIANEREY
ncbi:uncharacterized protein NEMAJ01_1532 [Nematocida major]|uniref:uncharacterized protein n=1 Tax=Nematocida major TaxID=1912982 RepID=UPI0020072F07|nr:uncharacterized protein NEMAJ01_1532 [Nematocida major]KAH9386636.1 hypothetical protein NEMAJ01_1532 [Nematocida major]